MLEEEKTDATACNLALYYNGIARSYEQRLTAKGYRGPYVAANALAGVFKDDRKSKVILDIGGGTGFVGDELKKEGFEIMDILDSADKMLDVARQKRIYRNVITTEINGLNSTPLEGGIYDAVLAIGVFCTLGLGFKSCDIPEIIRLTKPGGIIIITLRTATLYADTYRDNLIPIFEKMLSDGAWKQLERSKFKYLHDIEGQLFVYQKL